MKTHTTLLMLAASLAPLYAVQPSAAATAAQEFTALANTPAQGGMAATPELRAAVFNALALLPDTISDFAVATAVGDNLTRLARSGVCPELTTDALPAELLALDNIAVATTMATPATYSGVTKAVEYSRTVMTAMEIALNWTLNAHPAAAQIVTQETQLQTQALGHEAANHLQGIELPPTYVVLTCKPGQEGVLQSLYDEFISRTKAEGEDWITPVQDANGFTGARFEPGKRYGASGPAETNADGTPISAFEKTLRDEIDKRSYFIMARLQGNALILALCEDPAELKLASSPGDSLLSTNLTSPADVNLGKDMLGMLHVSKELAAVNYAAHNGYVLNLAAIMSKVFIKLGERDVADQTTFRKASHGMEVLAGQFHRFTDRHIQQPTTMQAWSDGDLHLLSTCDAQGCSFRPSELKLAALADEAQTTLYAENTPLHLSTPLPNFNTVAEAALDVAAGVTLTLAENERAQAAGAIATVRQFMPELRAFADAAATMGYGLNGHMAFVLDATHTSLPPIVGAEPDIQADIPRFTFYAQVTNRGQIASGWNALLTAAGQVVSKLGASPMLVNMLPITPTHMGNATSYAIALPFFTQDFVPSLTISDTGLALGSSARLNTQVVQSATGNTPFAGSAFAFKFAPLARSLRSLATAIDPTPEEAEPVASSMIRLMDDDDAAVRAYAHTKASTPATAATRQQQAADKLSTAASIFEQLSSVAEGVYGTATIENGLHTLRIKVKNRE